MAGRKRLILTLLFRLFGNKGASPEKIMARLIDTDPSYLKVSTAITPSPPMTWTCWFKPNTLGQNHRLLTQADEGTNLEQYHFSYGTSNNIVANVNDNGINRQATTGNTGNNNEWNFGCVIYASTSSRTAILNLDFDNKGTDTNSSIPANLDNTVIGALVRSTIFASGANFSIAHVAMWNKVLTDSQITAVGRGVNPLDLIGGGLVAYWPLLGDHDPEISLDATGSASHSMALVSSPAKDDHFGLTLQTQQINFPLIEASSSAARQRGGYMFQLGNKQEYSHGY